LFVRKARVIAVSLYPIGPTTAQAVWEDVAGKTAEQDYGAKFVNLGYVPGQAMGVQVVALLNFSQTMRTDFTGQPLGDARLTLVREAASLKNVKMIIELAATPESVRWWVEQLATVPNAPPVTAGVSAAAAPMSRPYLSAAHVKGLSGMITGISDAVAYAAQASLPVSASKRPGEITVTAVGSLSLASLVLIGLIVLGSLGQQVARLRKRR
jgi:hypothetical protein